MPTMDPWGQSEEYLGRPLVAFGLDNGPVEAREHRSCIWHRLVQIRESGRSAGIGCEIAPLEWTRY